jgi:antitoxin PrlF
MPRPLEEVSTITAKGQTTVPKSVRRALGLSAGDAMAFRIEKGRVSVRKARSEHVDPALGAFLALLEKDIAAGRNLRALPADLVAAMRRALKGAKVDLEEPIEGDVEL